MLGEGFTEQVFLIKVDNQIHSAAVATVLEGDTGHVCLLMVHESLQFCCCFAKMLQERNIKLVCLLVVDERL